MEEYAGDCLENEIETNVAGEFKAAIRTIPAAQTELNWNGSGATCRCGGRQRQTYVSGLF